MTGTKPSMGPVRRYVFGGMPDDVRVILWAWVDHFEDQGAVIVEREEDGVLMAVPVEWEQADA